MTVTDASTNVGAVEALVNVDSRTSVGGPRAEPVLTPGSESDQGRLDRHPGFYEPPLDGRAGPAARILMRAATVLDSVAMVEVVKGSIWGMGVIATWDQVVCPVLRALGQLPEYTGQEVAVERLLSRAVFEAFASVPRPETATPVRVLLACADGEQHTLALHAVGAAVAEIGIPCCSLGAGMPPAALHSAVRRIRPAVAVVWSQTAATADPAHLQPLLADQMLTGQPRCALIAAGPGWATADFPDNVARPDDLTDAVNSIVVAVEAATARSHEGGRPRTTSGPIGAASSYLTKGDELIGGDS